MYESFDIADVGVQDTPKPGHGLGFEEFLIGRRRQRLLFCRMQTPSLAFHHKRDAGTLRFTTTAIRLRSKKRLALINNMIAAVDIKRLAGDQLCAIHAEKRDGNSDIVDRHQAPGRRLRLRFLQKLIKRRDA
jgi:hypothetical protein